MILIPNSIQADMPAYIGVLNQEGQEKYYIDTNNIKTPRANVAMKKITQKGMSK